MLGQRLGVWGLALAIGACGGGSVERETPVGTTIGGGGGGEGGGATPPATAPAATGLRLPEGVRPTRYTLTLVIDPSQPRFQGVAEIAIELAARQDTIVLHGQDFTVSELTATPSGGSAVRATWESVGVDGTARVRLGRPIGPGRAMLRIQYSAPFFEGLEGLYRVRVQDRWYAYTQFEPLAARRAFPGFDEPRFKTPFDVTLLVRQDHVAIANTRQIEETPAANGMKTIRYATTEPLPTYLIAFAVGTLDVVDGPPIPPNAVRTRPLPFRGVATAGRGPELAYAMRETPGILAALEDYFGIPYPYDKLDVIAVPDFEAGAMENAGAITFREPLLLLGENASSRQRRGFAYVMAHELAHQWFGNLVTMPWWDDLWLNEAFATWMETVIVERWRPEYRPRVATQEWVYEAMNTDSLASARRIRNPIESAHDIHNAFDDITYAKGAAVLAMFERHVGADPFRQGIRRYLDAHRMGNATTEDLLAAISEAAGRDVAGPFRTFLTQPGVPFLEVAPVCEAQGGDSGGSPAEIAVRQRRYVPIGSSVPREQTWQVPVCVRMKVGSATREQCALIVEGSARIRLEGATCPEWVMPNAGASGYYRWSLDAEWMGRLASRGFGDLTEEEKLSYADSITASFAAGAEIAPVLAALRPLATQESRALADAPMEVYDFAWEYLVREELRPEVQRAVRSLYTPQLRRLGWDPPRGRAGAQESDEAKLLRARVIEILALFAEDPSVRREAVRRGRAYVGFGGDGRIHADAVSADVAPTALAVAAQEGGQPFVDALIALLGTTDDAVVRRSILHAIGSVRDPQIAERARGLTLDQRLRDSEIWTILSTQLDDPRTRDAAWQWMKTNIEPLSARAATSGGWLPWLVSGYCTPQAADEVQAFFAARVQSLPGGPRNLAGAAEAIRICAARAEAPRRDAASAAFNPAAVTPIRSR